jgi:hypothetical protein
VDAAIRFEKERFSARSSQPKAVIDAASAHRLGSHHFTAAILLSQTVNLSVYNVPQVTARLIAGSIIKDKAFH